jgi:tetratricopeptide (TPR) repeat protein
MWIACVLIVLGSSGVVEGKSTLLDELNRMEMQADRGRSAFWCGRYEDAEQMFAGLSESVHPSVMLYLNECAMCDLAQGDYEGAERRLRQVDSLLNTYQNVQLEKRATSAFGAEMEKVYRGDPYEQATAYLLLALVLADKGDYDNALAACKSGILADSDASENLFDSDLALLHALEAKCHLMRGEPQAFETCRNAAAKSVQLTSAQVRDDFSRRQDLLALLKMSRKERKKVGEKRKDDEIRAEIQRLSATLDRRMASVQAAELLGPLYSGDYNVLVLVPQGRIVEKTRSGSASEVVVFKKYAGTGQKPHLLLNGGPLDGGHCVATAVDLDFQATTRGGRRMDAILRGKAASKATTREVGKAVTDVGSDVGGVAGLGVALIGAAMQGAAAAMSAEADTRCWQTLPRQFQIYALKMGPGEHVVSGSHMLYFQKHDVFERTFTLTDEKDMAVVVMPPPMFGMYSARDEMKLSKRDRAGRDDSSTMLIPPPAGLDEIVRVTLVDEKAKPEAVAPDPKRLMRCVRKVLKTSNVPSALVTHGEVVRSRTTLASQHERALQCSFIELIREGRGKKGAYRAKLSFSLVDTTTGKVLARETTEGYCNDVSKGPSSAFYACVENATEAFIGRADLKL